MWPAGLFHAEMAESSSHALLLVSDSSLPSIAVQVLSPVLMSGCNLVLGAQHRSGSSIKETSQLRRAVVERHVGPQVALCCFQSYAII